MAKRRERTSVREAIKRLRLYAGYIGCGCYGVPEGGACRGTSTCARADYCKTLAIVRSAMAQVKGE